jgi:UDP-N-acetylglucosamine 2-epimerase (non-hydrolysing)
MRVMCVAGVRPNFMKVKPVMEALERRGVDVLVVHTGQHYDEAMSEVFFEDLALRRPDHALGVGSGTHAQQTGRVMVAMEELLRATRPDVVVVVGDVNSTLGAALAAAKSGRAVAHVEAGLRSGDWRMPEEINRVVIDQVSNFLFAPSDIGVANLRDEGFPPDRVYLVGDVMVDCLLTCLEGAAQRPTLERFGLHPRSYGLVTLHRPGNVDVPEILDSVVDGLEAVAEDLPLVFPVHPRTRAQLGSRRISSSVRMIEPLGYLEFLGLQAHARLLLTDSGSIQLEAHVLRVPCITLRETTERPETLAGGWNVLVGSDPLRIVDEARRILGTRPPPWRGPRLETRAGERIAAVLTGNGSLRPSPSEAKATSEVPLPTGTQRMP